MFFSSFLLKLCHLYEVGLKFSQVKMLQHPPSKFLISTLR